MADRKVPPPRIPPLRMPPPRMPATYQYRWGYPVCVLGKTGSGKTVWMQFLAANLDRVVIYDIKGTDGWDRMATHIVSDYTGLAKAVHGQRSFRVVVRPPIEAIRNQHGADDPDSLLAHFNAVCLTVHGMTTCALFADELGWVVRGKDPTPGMAGLLLAGRSREVSLVAGAQRNQDIPNHVITQARDIILYELSAYDRMAYAWLEGAEWASPAYTRPYEWVHVGPDAAGPRTNVAIKAPVRHLCKGCVI